MGNFNRDGRGSGGRDYGRPNSRPGGGGFRDRGSDRPAMHQATCSRCGKECEVPFKPTGIRPVFCSNCFENNGGSERRSEGNDTRRPNFEDRPMFDAICAQCGKDCKIPFQPREGKPVYCSNCFEDRSEGERSEDGRRNSTQPQSSEQLDAINSKLDKILALLNPAALTETVVEVEKEVATIQPEDQPVIVEKKKRAPKSPNSNPEE
ncbi:MAG: hypothetical protein Q7S88_01480 [Candidatus Daviesbacteria bacterium]|nr:hypothetical protein [Candidatus Daviesbacteria bacterium]